MEEREPPHPDGPRRVGAYRLVALLGEGGQGVVYRGEGPGGEQVAVKLLHAHLARGRQARARFAREVAHAARVAPFCTARVLDADVEGDRPYIVSEYVEGPTLAEMIATGRVPDGPALHRLAIATVTALAAIHEAGIVHRDFKPGNIIMGSDGPRVLDFGIARALDATGTLSSAVVGTPAYMAPEQIGGAVVGTAADIFAWGCTIVYAATGEPPFGRDSIPVVIHRILHEEPELGGVTGPLRDIVAACLAKDPVRRPTARAILLRLLGAEEPSPKSPSWTLLAGGATAAASLSASPAAEPSTAAPPAPAASGGPRPPETLPHDPGPAVEPRPPRVAVNEKAQAALSYVAAGAAIVLGTETRLPWARVALVVDRDLGDRVFDTATVTGLRLWGVLTLVMAACAMAIALADLFTRRPLGVLTVVPGAGAVAMLVAFRLSLSRLHVDPGALPPAVARAVTYRVSVDPNWYVALAAALAVVVLGLIALALHLAAERPR